MFFAAVARAKLMNAIAGATRALSYRAGGKLSPKRLGGMVLGGMLMLLALVAPVAASDGCNMVNDGELNRTLTYRGDTIANTILVGFQQGDTLNYSLNTTAEAMALIVIRYDSADTVIINSYDASNPVSVSGSYVVSLPPGAGSVTRAYIQLLGGAGGNYTALGASATWNISCVPAPPGPVVTSVAPTSGPIAGGTSVVITGATFTGATAVSFGSSAASYTVDSPTQITATSPAGIAGAVNVSVTTPSATSVAADDFRYFAPPTVTSITPSVGPTSGSTTVIITGAGFADAPGTGAVKFGATTASYTINSDTQITATAPGGSGTVDVTVTTPGGTSAITASDQYVYAPAPTVSSITPTAGRTAGGTTVIITGTGFSSAPGSGAVSFGGTGGASYTIDSDTQITAISPAHAAGTVDLTVTTPGGTSATSVADQFTYVAAPTVTSLGTTAGPTLGGTSVAIVGTGFSTATNVTFGGTPAAAFTINSSISITAIVPAGSAGTVDVRVTTVGGTSATSAADQFTYVRAPTVTSLTATAGRTSGGIIVIITGTGFAAAPGVGAVKFGSTAASYIITSDTQIAATSPAGSGTVDVTVTTVGGTSAISAADQYTYVPAPTVTGLTPSDGPTSGGTQVTITGTGFLAAPAAWAVYFGATPASYTIDSNTQITATSPAGSAGTVDVTVTTTGGTSATSAADQFTYVSAPTIVLVGPAAGPTAGGITVGIFGDGFFGTTAVTFGGIAATDFTVFTDYGMSATAPAGSAGTVDIRVTTVGGTSATSAADQFTYVTAPTVTSVTPTAGPTGGSTTVIITGSGFAAAPGTGAVMFGATPASYAINSATQITATAPAGSGTVDVTVTTPGGTSATSTADQFTYVPAPTITSVGPAVGPTSGGTTVNITGANLSGATAVTFGATSATGFTVNSDTSITATSPALNAGMVDIRVTTTGGTSATSASDQYSAVAQPSISSLSPASGSDAGGSRVIITGAALSDVTAVSFATTPATGFTIDSATQITAVAPAGVGRVNVQVTSIGGVSPDTVADDFVYLSISDAPTAVTAVAGDGQANVTFTAPAADGNSPITLYTASASPNGATGTVAGPGAGTITVAGLTNGQAYTFTVTAMNGEGTSTASAASNSVTPKGNQVIAFANPGSQNFGTTPTLSATSTSGAAPTFTSSTTGVCTISPSGLLTFITVGTCSIDADEGGDTAWNAATTMTQSFTVNAVVAGAPTSVVATAGDTQASVAFTVPTDTGGSAVTSYTVVANPPDVAPVNGAASPIVVMGLTNGVVYTFTVTANNVVGPGAVSVVSNSVIPSATQTITFASPSAQNFGTAPTLSATADSGLTPSFTSSTPAVCTISPSGALTFVSAGTCTINADQPGNSSYLPAPRVTRSFTVNGVLPGAPGMVGATISGTTAEISFTAPASTGGSAIIEYTATAAPGGATATSPSSPIAFAGLTGGQSYSFTVTASNAVGAGGPSAASNTVTASTAQTITFPDPGLLLAGGTATLTATASSGLPVSYSTTTPAICTVTTGGTLTLLTAGTCVVEVRQAGDGTYDAAPMVSLSLVVAPGSVTLTPTAGALPNGKVGIAETQIFSAAAGTGPYAFGISAGTLPAGLTLTGASLSGTPTAAGTFSFTVTATDANGVTASAAYTLLVVPSAVITLTPSAGALPHAMAGEDYTETVVASGHVGVVTYAATGTLPVGLAVGATSGEITGSVDVGAAGDYSFSITATDADTNTASVSYTLKVLAREVTVENKAVTVPAGSTPVPVNLTAGATGGPFSGGEVVGISPPHAGSASITGADVAAIDSNYDAIYLRFTPNPQYTGTARITYALTSTQGASAQGTVAYTVAADLGAVARAIQPISDGFISTRSGLLAGAVDTPGLQDRRAAGSAQLPGAISVTPSGNSMTMNFAASTLAATAASNAAESLVTASVDKGGLNFWIDGTATLHFRNDSVGDHWGSLALVSIGADMLVTDDLLVGVALHTDWMDDITRASRTAGTGLLVGPYVSAELADGVFLDASAYYGQSWNTITSGLFSGTFGTQRLLAKAGLSGQWRLSDKLTLQPAANLFYLHEEAGGYTVSDGPGNTANIASFALDQLRASVGAILRYSIDVDGNLVITPFLGVELGMGLTNGTGGSFGTLSTGFDITGLGEWTLGFSVEAGIENGSLRSISATGRARANF